MSKRALLCSVAYALFAFAAHGREGFGFTKRAIEMNRLVPPAVNVSGTRVTVSVDSERSRVSGSARTLQQYIESAVLAGDKKLQTAPNGDVKIAVALDRLDADQTLNSKVESNYEKTKDKNGKTKYVNNPKTKLYTTARVEIAGTFKVLDSKGRVLDSGDIDRHFQDDYEYGAPSNDRLEDDQLRWAADKIASRIVPTHVKTKVLVPKGSFEQYIPLAESGNFEAYRTAVESVRPLNDRASDAFREYALGVAYEGLAYQQADPKQGLEMMRKAAEHYHTAATNNPEEKLFSEKYTGFLTAASGPLDRIDGSVKRYESWASGPTKAPASQASTASAAPRKAIRNQNIIDMTKAGLSEENILLVIENASETDFDTTPDGLIRLSKAGVSKNVIAKMQKR